MENNSKFLQLINSARAYMEEHGFSYTSVANCMRTWRSIYNFALSKGIDQYSAELAEQYMQEKYGMAIGENSADNTEISIYLKQKIRALRALTDYRLTGFIYKEKRSEVVIWPARYKDPCEKYLNNFKTLGYMDSTIRAHELALFRFITFLEENNVELKSLAPEHIYEYFKTLTAFAKSTLVNIRITLVHALRDFYDNGYCGEDLSVHVPFVRYYSKSKLDKVWEEEEISQMLSCIDRANPLGKRDYAIMLIAANLGLRTSDILALRMSNFDWRHNEINLVQYKTNEPLTLPISQQIGAAIIDYWKNGRPDTVTEEIFVQHTLPYKKLTSGSVTNMFNKYFNASGITVPSTRSHGLHSFRHSLASRLLEHEVPVNVIGNILGHVDSESSKNYLRIDIDKLRKCSLEVPDYE